MSSLFERANKIHGLVVGVSDYRKWQDPVWDTFVTGKYDENGRPRVKARVLKSVDNSIDLFNGLFIEIERAYWQECVVEKDDGSKANLHWAASPNEIGFLSNDRKRDLDNRKKFINKLSVQSAGGKKGKVESKDGFAVLGSIVSLKNETATLKDIVEKMGLLAHEAKAGDVVFIYLTGHGYLFAENVSNQVGSICPDEIAHPDKNAYEKHAAAGDSALLLYPEGEYLSDDVFTMLLKLFEKGVRLCVVSDFGFSFSMVDEKCKFEDKDHFYDKWVNDFVGAIYPVNSRSVETAEAARNLQVILRKRVKEEIMASVCVFSSNSKYVENLACAMLCILEGGRISQPSQGEREYWVFTWVFVYAVLGRYGGGPVAKLWDNVIAECSLEIIYNECLDKVKWSLENKYTSDDDNYAADMYNIKKWSGEELHGRSNMVERIRLYRLPGLSTQGYFRTQGTISGWRRVNSSLTALYNYYEDRTSKGQEVDREIYKRTGLFVPDVLEALLPEQFGGS